MNYSEEDIANDLHRALTREFKSPPATISINGAGDWHCTAERDNSRCKINCFRSYGTEYYTDFTRDSVDVATSRIPSRDDTIAAVRDWLDGQDLPFIYDRYPFVDRVKRALTRIRDDAIANSPALQARTNSELQHHFGDFYYLHFRTEDRSCEISFYGKNELPDAKFSWDNCPLFQFQPDDNARLAAVLKRWLCDHAPPSHMRTEFPWLDIGELADCYENGKPIEGEYIHSWNEIEHLPDFMLMNDELSPLATRVKEFIAALRQKGYDRSFRAGRAMFTLILSRSLRHGMRSEQPCVAFTFLGDGMNVYRGDAKGFYTITWENGNTLKATIPTISLTAQIETTLNWLSQQPID